MDPLVTILSTANETVNEAEVVDYATKAVDRLVPDWTYAANTSNQAKFGSYTLALATLLSLPTFPQELAIGIARRVLQEDMKSIYRSLTTLRQAQTIPVLKLLRQIARLIPQDIFTSFDFTLRAIPKILSQQPYRHSFLEFYMELISASAPQTRRDLFGNRKIFSGWIGKLGLDDDESTLKATMAILHNIVLKDTVVFTKTTKMGLFNDWTLKNMHRLLSSSNAADSPVTEELTEQISRFLIVLFCDRTYGVRMPGENRLALSFLKIVKPWENITEMDLVVRLLREMPDLLLPYFDGLASTYTLTPKQSMWWFSYSVLHIRALKLPVSHSTLMNATILPGSLKFDKTAPKLELASKYVMPRTVTKAALLQSLQFDSSLVKFQAAQIILFTLRRLNAVVDEIYVPNKWDAEALIDDVLQHLPEINLFAKATEPPLLRMTYLLIVKLACQLRPLTLNIPLPLDAAEVHGLDLVEAETVLEVQTYTSDQTKWWSPSKDRLSLFTQLVQFATYNFKLADKSSELLQRLVRPTQLFSDMPVLAHPVDALLQTLTGRNSPAIWAIIDQAVQRAVRSPYQYIDTVRSDRVSPFAVAVIEQYAHIRKNNQQFSGENWEAVLQWLISFMRSMVVLGEDRATLHGLLVKSVDDFTDSSSIVHLPHINSDEYFDFVLDAPDKTVLKRQDLVFKISNKLELAATLFRIVESKSEGLRNHLLASIPADMHSLMCYSPAAFGPFVAQNNDPDLCKAFLAIIDDVTSSSELTNALQQSPNWTLGLSLLSTGFLVSKLMNNDSGSLELNVLSELNKRQYQLDSATIHSVLSSELVTSGPVLDELAKNLALWDPKWFDRSEALDIMMRVNNSPQFVASLVRVSGRYPQKHPLGLTAPVLVAGARYAPQDLDVPGTLNRAQELLKQGDTSALAILAELLTSIPAESSVWDQVSDVIEKSKQSSRSVLIPDLLILCFGGKKTGDHIPTPTPFLGRFLKIVVHQLTRQFAEKTIENTIFLSEFTSILQSNDENLWQHVHQNAINALLEAALRFNPETSDMRARIYELVSVLSSNKSSHQATLAQLTTLFETRKPASTDLDQVVAIYSLFTNDNSHENNATDEVEQAILVRYSGTLAAKDLILLSILKQIESVRQRSWMEKLQSLDVRPAAQVETTVDDYNLDPLITTRGQNSLFVTLDEQMIRTTIQTYEPAEAENFADQGVNKSYQEFRDLISAYGKRAPANAEARYDSWFLLGFVVSAKYLYENMEVFLSSGLVSFVICTLVSPEPLSGIGLRVLMYVFSRLPEAQFKDQVGLRLLLGKLLMLQANCEQESTPLPSHIPGMLGQIALVLTKPTHFLHDRVTQWLLASPQISKFDVPLFKAICESSADLKMREMLWLVNTLKSGCVDDAATQTYIRRGVMEWCLVQLDLLSPRAAALKDAIRKLLYRVEELRNASELLINHSGAFAVPELQSRLLYTAGPDRVVKWTVN